MWLVRPSLPGKVVGMKAPDLLSIQNKVEFFYNGGMI